VVTARGKRVDREREAEEEYKDAPFIYIVLMLRYDKKEHVSFFLYSSFFLLSLNTPPLRIPAN
jgi:hypothetical protein